MKRSAFLLVIVLIFATTSSGFELITLFGGGPAGTPTVWDKAKFPIGYSIHNAGTQGISASAVATQFNKVIGIINKQSPLKFKNLGTTTSVVSGDGQNGVIFDNNFQFGSFALAVQRLGGSSAAPNKFSEGDLVFNDRDYDFTLGATNLNTDTYNLFTVMLHEMGHGTGLQHTLLKNAVMFFQFQKDVTTLALDDKSGIKFDYKNGVKGTLPKLISPINKGLHSVSSVSASGKLITFRWRPSQSAAVRVGQQGVAATYTLVFAGDSAFTKTVTRYNAFSKLVFLIKGTKLAKLKNIQAASPTQQVFWRVEEKNGTQILKSLVFNFKIN